jgi:hypothetical protein
MGSPLPTFIDNDDDDNITRDGLDDRDIKFGDGT